MTNKKRHTYLAQIDRLVEVLLRLPWLELLTDLWRFAKKILQDMTNEGMYEVLEYEITLELKGRQGENATVKKREKVRYLQDNIIAYQDQAWGDGEILINYRCSPGTVADQYRSGYKTYILISLREVKNKGDIDEFNIHWNIRRGFLRQTEQWETDINHHTKYVKVQVIFPKNRPPLHTSVAERNRQRTLVLGQSAQTQLPDGRWRVSWETDQPRLHEHYLLKWDW